MPNRTPLEMDLRGLDVLEGRERLLRAFLRLDQRGSLRVLLDADPAPMLHPLRLIYGDELDCDVTAEPPVWTLLVRSRRPSTGPLNRRPR